MAEKEEKRMDIVNQLKAHVTEFLAKDGWVFTQIKKVVDLLQGVYQFLPEIILIALGLVVLFFGKKILPLEKILAFFGVGFFVGYQVLAPWAAETIKFEMTPMIQVIIGCVVGVVCILLFKVLYFLAVVGVFGGGGFAATLLAIDKIEALKTAVEGTPNLNFIIAGVVALIVVLIAFWLLKFIEMLGTSLIGAAVITFAALRIYNFAALVNIGSVAVAGITISYASLIVIAVLFLIGSIVQIKTRRLY